MHGLPALPTASHHNTPTHLHFGAFTTRKIAYRAILLAEYRKAELLQKNLPFRLIITLPHIFLLHSHFPFLLFFNFLLSFFWFLFIVFFCFLLLAISIMDSAGIEKEGYRELQALMKEKKALKKGDKVYARLFLLSHHE
mgnify:CR=1 FL=1